METHLFSSLLAFLFMLVQYLIRGSQTCSKFEFVNVPDKILAVEGTLVNVTFYLDTRQCPPNQTSYSITLSRDNNGRHEDVCKLLQAKKCTTSASSVGCSCLSFGGPMLFSKNVTSADDNSVYVWKWGDAFPGEKEKRIKFQIVTVGGATTDAAARITAVAKSDAVQSRDGQPDPRNFAIVVVAASAGVVVIVSAVIVTACACYRRGYVQRPLRHELEKDFVMSRAQDVSHLGTTLEECQARNTYDEILDAPKPHRVSSVCAADPSGSRKSGAKLPPLPLIHLRYVATPRSSPLNERKIPSSSHEYLHPQSVIRTRDEENEEFSVVRGVQSPPAVSSQLSNSL